METKNTTWIPILNERTVPQKHQFRKSQSLFNEGYIFAIQRDRIRINSPQHKRNRENKNKFYARLLSMSSVLWNNATLA